MRHFPPRPLDPSETSTFPQVVSLLVGATLVMTGSGLMSTLVSLRMAAEGFPVAMSGTVLSAYYGGLVLGSLGAQRMIHQVGHIRAFAAFAAVLSASTLGHALWVAAVPWALLRLLMGASVAGFLTVTESWLNECAEPSTRGRVLSIYMTLVYFALGASQLLVNLASPSGSQLFEISALLFSASMLPVVLTRVAPVHEVERSTVGFRELAAASPLGLSGAVVAGVAFAAVQALGPRYAAELGMSLEEISIWMAVFFGSGLLLQWPAGRYSDRVDRRGVLIVVLLVAAGAAAAMTFVGPSQQLLAIGLFGSSVATIYPLSVALANDQLPGRSVVGISAALILGNGLGATLGPIGASLGMAALGIQGLFAFSGASLLLLAAYAALRTVQVAPVPEEDKTPFESAAMQTMAVATELDPRADHEHEVEFVEDESAV